MMAYGLQFLNRKISYALENCREEKKLFLQYSIIFQPATCDIFGQRWKLFPCANLFPGFFMYHHMIYLKGHSYEIVCEIITLNYSLCLN
jgi:hypothetical protein